MRESRVRDWPMRGLRYLRLLSARLCCISPALPHFILLTHHPLSLPPLSIPPSSSSATVSSYVSPLSLL